MFQNFRDNGIGHIESNIVLFVTIDKFDPNPVLVNINELKPYKFIENKTLQPILIKLNDLITDEPIQIEELEALHVEHEDLQLIGFELINNYLIHGNIIRAVVHVHYYHDVPIEFNHVLIHNDQNNAFSEKLIDVYILEVYNTKGHIYS
jgi:hypothetical protein